MQIGPYTLYSIETSEFALDGGAMFGIIPKPLWEKKAPSDDQNRISMVTRSLLLVSEDRKIIVDTGNGSKWQEKFKDIYRIELDNMNMERSLNKYGFFHISHILVFYILWKFSPDLPSYSELKNYKPSLTTRVFTSDGMLLDEYFIEERLFVPIEKIPKKLILKEKNMISVTLKILTFQM